MAGIAGRAGLAGIAGAAGLAGIAGRAGLAGIAGAAGLAGIAGAAGLAGIAGRAGLAGAAGLAASARHILTTQQQHTRHVSLRIHSSHSYKHKSHSSQDIQRGGGVGTGGLFTITPTESLHRHRTYPWAASASSYWPKHWRCSEVQRQRKSSRDGSLETLDRKTPREINTVITVELNNALSLLMDGRNILEVVINSSNSRQAGAAQNSQITS